MSIQTLTTKSEISDLVALLRSPQRSRPVAVISTRMNETATLINAEQVASTAGHLADIFTVRSGPLTFELTDRMADGTQVFGGAGRVYPAGTAWEADISLSPLRFAYAPEDGPHSTAKLIDDIFACGKRPAPSSFVNRLGDSSLSDILATARARAAVAPAATVRPEPITHPAAAIAAAALTAAVFRAAAPTPAPGIVRVSLPALNPAAAPAQEYAPKKNSSALAETQLALFAARSEIAALKQAAAATPTTPVRVIRTALIAAPSDEFSELRVENATLTRDLADTRIRHQEQLAAVRKKPGKTADCAVANAYNPDLFLNPDDAVRHAVTQMWAQRIPATEKIVYPLPAYLVGPEFAASLDKLDDPQTAKAFKCVVDVLTDLAKQNPARRVHPLRTGVGGDDQALTRSDCAVCFRANVEGQTASARRLHYWKLADGTIELSRVVTHDDVQP